MEHLPSLRPQPDETLDAKTKEESSEQLSRIQEEEQAENAASPDQNSKPKAIKPDQEDPMKPLKITIKARLQMLRSLIKMYTFKDGYLQLIRNFLSCDFQGEETMKDSKIAFFDRIAYVIRFCSPSLKEILEHCEEYAISNSAIEFVILFGKQKKTEELLRAYIDQSRDIQTSALLGFLLDTFGIYKHWKDLETVFSCYYNLLNKHELHKHRANMDLMRYEIRKKYGNHHEKTVDPNKISLYCKYCKTELAHQTLVTRKTKPKSETFGTSQMKPN